MPSTRDPSDGADAAASERIASAAEHIHALLPATGAQIRAILERAEALYERLPQEPPGFAYGDFKADHLWVTAEGLTLIDFDTCYLFDQTIDHFVRRLRVVA